VDLAKPVSFPPDYYTATPQSHLLMLLDRDLANRQNAIAGTITLNNSPASRNGTLDDYLSLGVNAKDIKIRDVMSTLAGPLCYIYV